MKENTRKHSGFKQTRMTFGFVLHASLGDIEKIKALVEEFADVNVVYQRVDAGHLYIRAEGE